MRRVSRVIPWVVLGLAATAAVAQDAKGQLTLYVETTKMAIPGLEGIKLPPEAAGALAQFQAGTRTLRVELHTPGAPPAAPEANLDLPDSLKLGKTLPLEIPKPGQGAQTGNDPMLGGSPEKMEFRRYWSCGATVKPGQPKVMRPGQATPEQLARLRGLRGQVGAGGAATDTWAYWPNSKDRMPRKIDEKAGLPGKYLLRTNFAGQVGFEVPANVQFMAPVTLSTSTDDLAKPITLSWKPVEGAVAYFAMAFGVKGKDSFVMWNSADTDEGSEAGYAPTAEIRAQVEKGTLLAPSRVECTIPVGIFQGCQSVTVMVHAYGPGHWQPAPMAGVPNVRVVTRSVGMTPLGGPKFPGLGVD